MVETCAKRAVFLLAPALVAVAAFTLRAGESPFKGTLTPPGSVQKVLLLDRDLPQDLV